MPPPNPIRNLDNSLTTVQQQGKAFYSGARPSDGVNNPALNAILGQSSFSCNGCHTLDAASGFFGTGGNQSFEGLTQIVKIPHLRNAYTKIGMFGNPVVGFFDQADSGPMGDQIRGFRIHRRRIDGHDFPFPHRRCFPSDLELRLPAK